MKLSNILSALFFLFISASCSMEEDIINGSSNTNTSTTVAEGMAYVSVGVNLSNSSTKATKSSSEPTKYTGAIVITNCTVLLLDATGNIRYRFFKSYRETPNQSVETVASEDFNLLVKYGTVTKAIAILNASPTFITAIAGCKTQTDLEAIRETSPGYQLATGETAIDWTVVAASPSTTDIVAATVTIDATKRISLVDIVKFSVKYNEGCAPATHSVKLENFWLTKKKENVGLYSEGAEEYVDETYDANAVSFVRQTFVDTDGEHNHYSSETDATTGILKESFNLSTYQKGLGYASRLICPNQDGKKKTMVHIRYSVTDSRGITYKEAAFDVNSAVTSGDNRYVAPGFWYSLDVTVNVKKDYADCDIQCYTKDWVNEDIEVIL